MFMSSPQQPEQEKGGLDKPAARAALPEQSEAEFEPAESPPKVLRDFVEEPVVRETILVTGSCDEGVFSLPTPVVQVDGSGMIVAGFDWKVETLEGGTKLSPILDGCTALHKTYSRPHVPGAEMV